MNDYIDGLRVRSKKRIHREYEKGIITWDNEEKCFLDSEGKELVGLHFKRKGLDDMFEDEEFGEDEELDDENDF